MGSPMIRTVSNACGQLVCGAYVVELPDELLADAEHGERTVQRCCEAGNNDNHADDVGSGERYVEHVAGDDGDCEDGDDVLRSRHHRHEIGRAHVSTPVT